MIGRAPHQCQIPDLAAVLQKQPGTGIQTHLVNVHFIADRDRKKHRGIGGELLAKRPGIGCVDPHNAEQNLDELV